jgi:hypothetical protein
MDGFVRTITRGFHLKSHPALYVSLVTDLDSRACACYKCKAAYKGIHLASVPCPVARQVKARCRPHHPRSRSLFALSSHIGARRARAREKELPTIFSHKGTPLTNPQVHSATVRLKWLAQRSNSDPHPPFCTSESAGHAAKVYTSLMRTGHGRSW